MRKRLHLVVGLLLVGALAAAACGGNDADPPEDALVTDQADDSEADAAPDEPAPGDANPDEVEAEADEPEDVALPEEDAEAPDQAEPEPESDLDRELLTYGETFAAAITEVDGVRQFRFEGEEFDLVRIRVDGKDGMDPIVTLLEPNRTEVTSNDDESLGANRDSLLIASLVSSGLQVVRVEAFGTDIGNFEISIELLPFSEDTDSEVLSIGSTVTGSIWEPGDVDTFEFAGTAGQPVRVYVDGAVGVDLRAQIFGPDAAVIQASDDSGHGLDPELLLVLATDGSYRVDVFAVGNKIGPYEFSVKTIGEETAEPDPAVLQDMENTALSYLAALQAGDSLSLFALAGPEAIVFRGWESDEDVTRDLAKLAETVVLGEPGTPTSSLEDDRGRVTIPVADAGSMRFDMINTGGRWSVDFWERVFEVPDDS
ncbi:MAG TPA: hypothetical protein QGF05_05290, partial [Dehalococcoidia bacterium]|nr:hypothetical protein [Dehalococcoidia bacterium]